MAALTRRSTLIFSRCRLITHAAKEISFNPLTALQSFFVMRHTLCGTKAATIELVVTVIHYFPRLTLSLGVLLFFTTTALLHLPSTRVVTSHALTANFCSYTTTHPLAPSCAVFDSFLLCYFLLNLFNALLIIHSSVCFFCFSLLTAV